MTLIRLDGGGTFNAVEEEQRKAVEERIAAASSGKVLEELTFDKMQQIRSFYTQVRTPFNNPRRYNRVPLPKFTPSSPLPGRNGRLQETVQEKTGQAQARLPGGGAGGD